MLEGMVDCAHVLAMAFGAAAKDEADTGRSLERFDAFQKCFLSVRMGIRLCMTLRAGKATAGVASLLGRPAEAERAEALDRERPEHEAPERGDPPERERDRDYEPVSLPRFLATLGVVARDAARFDDGLPADAKQALPVLRNLLAEAQRDPFGAEAPPTQTPMPVAGVAVLTRSARGGTRDRLLGSAAASSPRLGPHGRRPWSGFG
ncbi:hypothetical protein [Phenylobacterium sp.]|uniref:hypothetical protein n=1 Tax=Phenylobacterium sp. TaxID=1871053 RepID=UPI0025DC3C16|nr:hypothetical protein [Phenylobacterium sp.]